MRQILGVLVAAALVGLVATASADELTGPIKQIYPAGNTFVIGDTVFAASLENTVGAKLSELKPGDKVTVFYETDQEPDKP